ncbi:MAG: VWA domain-containing protein, partial [Desulfatitalea sp.]|nr:VWA domain-containing protein [Desulfatitalea sp.]
MKFANIEILFFLWLLPLLTLLYWYGRRRRRGILAAFGEPSTLAALLPPGITGRRRLKAVLAWSALLLLVLAMAGPRYGFQWQEVQRHGVDLMIALDCSQSMLADDIQPTRLDRAKREIIDLLTMLGGDRAGLVAFSGTAFVQCPLTLDYSAFDLFLNVLAPGYLPLGGTNMAAAVQTALSAFDTQNPADKAIILITDGEHTGHGDPEAAARKAKAAGVKLFCIGVGSAEGVPVPAAEGGFKKDAAGQIVLTRLDEALLTRMAVATGGTYVRSVAGDMDLEVIYRDHIRGAMTGATMESDRKQVWADRYQWPLAMAILLLLAGHAVPTVRRRLIGLLAVSLLTPCAMAHAGPLQQGYKAYEAGDFDAARQQFIEGQLEDPENPRVLYNLGNAYYKTGNFEAARDHFSQALSQADPALKADLLYNLGNTAFRLGDHQEAIKDYQAALALAPEDHQAQENLDFVKKLLEQQQQQQQQDDTGKQQDQQDQTEPQQKQNPDSGSEKQNETEEKRDGGQKDQPQQPPQSEQESEAKPQPAAGERQDADPAQGDAPQMSQPAADRMLNRLKDEPGRAVMPRY